MSQILKFSKMVFNALLARLDPAQSRLKAAANLLFSTKIGLFLAISVDKSKFAANLRRLCVGSKRARRAQKTIFENFRIGAFSRKSFKALGAVFLIFF